MRHKVMIIDTSILCVWLNVPDMSPCGKHNEWDTQTVSKQIDSAIADGFTLVLPLAVIIESGNHIAHAHGDKYCLAQNFAGMINDTVEEKSPWAAFTHQKELWESVAVQDLIKRWVSTVSSGQSLGDASIIDVVNYYNKIGCAVEIFTADEGLKSYEPSYAEQMPRRRKQ